MGTGSYTMSLPSVQWEAAGYSGGSASLYSIWAGRYDPVPLAPAALCIPHQ